MNACKDQTAAPVIQASGKVGGQIALARLLGVSASAVNQWVKGIRRIPEAQCPDIEFFSGIRCESLRPDVNWLRSHDFYWPHPGGRPLIDYSRAVHQTRGAGIHAAGRFARAGQ